MRIAHRYIPPQSPGIPEWLLKLTVFHVESEKEGLGLHIWFVTNADDEWIDREFDSANSQ